MEPALSSTSFEIPALFSKLVDDKAGSILSTKNKISLPTPEKIESKHFGQASVECPEARKFVEILSLFFFLLDSTDLVSMPSSWFI